MIDIENKIFTTVATSLRTTFTGIYVCSPYVENIAQFPCVTIEEVENTTYEDSQDDSLREHNATLTYEINVYSDLKNGRKSEAKSIANKVDELMQDLKFTRLSVMRTPSEDTSIYRITLRYEVVASEGKTSTDGTTTTITHQLYRR